MFTVTRFGNLQKVFKDVLSCAIFALTINLVLISIAVFC